MEGVVYTGIDSPVGPILMAATVWGLCSLTIQEAERSFVEALEEKFGRSPRRDHAPLVEAALQVREYLDGQRQTFSLPLDLRGTPFQQRVWEAVRRIPYGQTRTYGEIARAIGSPDQARAVGAANGANPVPLVVP